MLLTIILSDFQQYRTLLAKVIHFFVSPEKCENLRYKFLQQHILPPKPKSSFHQL